MHRSCMMLAALALLAPAAHAQQSIVWRSSCAGGNCRQPAQVRTVTHPVRRVYYGPAPRVTPVVPMAQVAPAVVPTSGDALGYINAYRTKHGLRALGWDASLAANAANNNVLQSRRGLGHHTMAGRRQNAVMTSDPARAAQVWYASPNHRNAILDPSMTYAGVSYSYGYATMNFR